MSAQLKDKAFTNAQRSTHRYGTIELEEDWSDDEINDLEDDHDYELDHTPRGTLLAPNKRWSVLDKLDRQYTRERTCISCLRNVTSKCVLATLMLIAFFVFAWYFTRTLLFNIQLNPDIYDFIVVGGGSAGSVVARRLLDEGATVLVLESGDSIPYVVQDGTDTDSSTISEYDIPLLWSSVAQNTEVHYGPFDSLNISPFKGLGGGGMHSALLHVRALSSDVLAWGVPSFDWTSMLSAYVQLERYTYSTLSLENGAGIDDVAITSSADATLTSPHHAESPTGTNPTLFRGLEGHFPTSAPGCKDSLSKSFISAAMQQGEQYIFGFNRPGPRTGVGCYEVNIEAGVRASPVKSMLDGYIKGSSKRLTLHTQATVHRVLLNREQATGLTIGTVTGHKHHQPPAAPLYRATGVEYTLNNELRYAYLSSGPERVKGRRDFENVRSVVLAAGAVHTPALLMKSGIGGGAALRSADIEVKVDSPGVGANLQDHIAVGLTFQAAGSVGSDYGNAYAFPQQWSSYTKAVHRALNRNNVGYSKYASSGRGGKVDARLGATDTEAYSESSNDQFGLLGTNGVSAGAFLVSPFSTNKSIPDIQITLYPAVNEPHFLAMMAYKGRKAGSVDSGSQYRNQMLITVALLSPEARFQVTLNATHPFLGTPSVRPSPPFTEHPIFSTSSTTSKGSRRRELGAADQAKDDAGSYNIVPSALSDFDVRRLSWAVRRVRRIVTSMQVQGSGVAEVSPGSSVGPAADPASASGGGGSGPSENDPQVPKSGLDQGKGDMDAWVRENAFMVSNWVGTAAMGRSIAYGGTWKGSSSSSSRSSAGTRSLRAAAASTTDTAVRAEVASPTPIIVVPPTPHDTDTGTTDEKDEGGDPNDSDDLTNNIITGEEGCSVVDEELGVWNVLSLKIADASVIPRVPSGNVHATVLAVAWKAAGFILKPFI